MRIKPFRDDSGATFADQAEQGGGFLRRLHQATSYHPILNQLPGAFATGSLTLQTPSIPACGDRRFRRRFSPMSTLVSRLTDSTLTSSVNGSASATYVHLVERPPRNKWAGPVERIAWDCSLRFAGRIPRAPVKKRSS